MAQLSDTIVTGKLAVTSKIYEGGTALDNKFAAGIGVSGNTIQLKDAEGNTLPNGNFHLPEGAFKINTGSITLSMSTSGNNYVWSGSRSINASTNTELTPGWITSSQVVGGTITASHTVAKSKITCTRANGNAVDTYDASITDVDPGQSITIFEGYYPSNRTITVSKADRSSEATAGAATSGYSVLNTSTLASQTTSANDYYTINIQPYYNVTTAGWLGTGQVNGTTVTRYVQNSVITNNNSSLPSGASSSGTISCGKIIKIGAGYYPDDRYYTAQTAAAGASGTYTVNDLPTGNGTDISGYKYVKVKTGSAGAITGGGVSGGAPSVIGASLTGSSVSLNDTNNGISVTMAATARRATVTRAAASYSVTPGWISSAGTGLSADSTTLAQADSAETTITKYISTITVPSSKTLSTVTNNGTITTLSNGGTIGTLSVVSGASSTISSVTGTHTISNSTGTLNIHHTTANSGKVVLWEQGDTSNSYTVLNAGKLVRTSLSNISGSKTVNPPDMSLSNNNVSATLESSQPSGYRVKITTPAQTYTNITLKNDSAISAGWLSAIGANSTLGSASLDLNAGSAWISIPTLAGTNAVDFSEPTLGNISSNKIYKNASASSGYYFDIPVTATFTPTTAGYAATTDSFSSGTGDNIKKQRYSIASGSVTTGVSGTTGLTVTLSKTGTFVNNASSYGITTTQPSSGTDGTNFVTLTLSGDNPSSTLTGTKSVTEGYIKTGNVTANGTSISAGLSGGTSYYVPIVTPAFDGGGLTGGGLTQSGNSGGGLSGGGLTQSGNSGGGLTWSNSNVTTSSTDNGIRIKVNRAAFSNTVTRAQIDRAAFSNTVTRAKVNRAAVLYNGARKGLINIADDTQALAAGSLAADTSTVSLAADSIASTTSTVSLSADSITAYITGITVPNAKDFSLNLQGSGTITLSSDSTTASTKTINVYGGKTANRGVSIENRVVTVDGDGTNAGTSVTDSNGDLITTSRSASTGTLAAVSGVTLGDFLTTTSTNNYGGFVGKGSVSTGTGWITSGTTSSSNSSTYYIKAGALSNISGGGLTHGNTTFTTGADTYLTDTNTGYAITASNTASRAAISAGVSTAGWIPTSASKSVAASGDDTKTATKYIIAGASTAQTVNGSASFTQANMVTSTSDSSSGISITPKATNVSRRGKITTAGWMPLNTYCGDKTGSLTGTTAYLTGITLVGTLGSIVFAGGTITEVSVSPLALTTSSSDSIKGTITTLMCGGTVTQYNSARPVFAITNLGRGEQTNSNNGNIIVSESPAKLKITNMSRNSELLVLLQNNHTSYDPSNPYASHFISDLFDKRITVKDRVLHYYRADMLGTNPIVYNDVDLTDSSGVLIEASLGNITGGVLSTSGSNLTTSSTNTSGISISASVSAASCTVGTGWIDGATSTTAAQSDTEYITNVTIDYDKEFTVYSTGLTTVYNNQYGSNYGDLVVHADSGVSNRFYTNNSNSNFTINLDDDWQLEYSGGSVYFRDIS